MTARYQVAGVKLHSPAADGVVGFKYQGHFSSVVVNKLFHLREKGFHVLIDAEADAGRVDADIGHVVLLRKF